MSVFLVVDVQNLYFSWKHSKVTDELSKDEDLVNRLEQLIQLIPEVSHKVAVIDEKKLRALQGAFSQSGYITRHRCTRINSQADDLVFLAEAVAASFNPKCTAVLLCTGDGALGSIAIEYVQRQGKKAYTMAVGGAFSSVLKKNSDQFIELAPITGMSAKKHFTLNRRAIRNLEKRLTPFLSKIDDGVATVAECGAYLRKCSHNYEGKLSYLIQQMKEIALVKGTFSTESVAVLTKGHRYSDIDLLEIRGKAIVSRMSLKKRSLLTPNLESLAADYITLTSPRDVNVNLGALAEFLKSLGFSWPSNFKRFIEPSKIIVADHDEKGQVIATLTADARCHLVGERTGSVC